jgi:enolase
MKIKEVGISVIKDSRCEDTIEISINGCSTSAPAGKSTGKYEVPAYKGSLKNDMKNVKGVIALSQFEFKKFDDLYVVENLLKNKVGANTLFALESSILKAIAKEQGKELWQILGKKKIPKLLSNLAEGGKHSKGKRPDFQEFLVIGDKKTNTKAYKEIGNLLKSKGKTDENAWKTDLENDRLVELLSWGDLKFGLDIAASEFFKSGKYSYKNPKKILSRKEHINYIIDLINKYKISYVEDSVEENDFSGFKEILKKTKGCLIVGDDLTVTNLKRVIKAVSNKAINGVIVKPNQTGSLLEVAEVVKFCKKAGVKTIMSHRSGETMDNTIADLAVGFGCDMIKIPVAGKERLAKVNRLMKIRRKLR